MNKILILEDDETLNKNISFVLEEEGYTVLSARCIGQAEQLWRKADLLLLDVMLPDGSGLELCDEIRKSSEKPIIFLTSCDEETDIIKGLDRGADDYITKPFRLRELLSRIKANLRRIAIPMPDMELTAVERKLLEYLMMNRDRFLTRDQLLEYLWDSKGCFVNDNTLSVNISRLRDKIRENSFGQIVTKRGVGYKWTDQTNS